MKLAILAYALLASFSAHAAKELTFEQIRDRLQIKGDIFRTDASGKQLLGKGLETKSWRLRKTSNDLQIEGNWGADSDEEGGIAIHYVWTLNKDRSMKILIEEYAREEKVAPGKYEFKDLLKKEERPVENFSPVTWVSARPGSKGKTVVRFVPTLSDEDEAKPMESVMLSGTEMIIYDNEGYLWTDHVSGGGKYFGLSSHRGTVMLSYYPFTGAKPMGTAKGDRIELALDGKKSLSIQSKTDFLPRDMHAVVYGRYVPGQKTSGVSSTHFSTSNSEKNMLENMKE